MCVLWFLRMITEEPRFLKGDLLCCFEVSVDACSLEGFNESLFFVFLNTPFSSACQFNWCSAA